MRIDGKTKQLGVIGMPVEHSFSPGMHNFILEYMKLNYVYSAWEVRPENLKTALDGVRAMGIKGINVTAPHKKAVMEYLDEISQSARKLGSVNTVVNRDGKLCGYNTDADGFCMALENAGISLTDKKILVIGAGGVVEPTLTRITEEKPKSITTVNRTKSKAQSIADKISKQTGFNIETELDRLEFDIVINTTSAGMIPQTDRLPIEEIEEIPNLDFINKNTVVVDMIYNPDETLFLKLAREKGAKTLNGLGMLICQGLLAFELFTGEKLPENMIELVKKEVFNR